MEAAEAYLLVDTRSKPYDTFYERKRKMLDAVGKLGAELAYLGWVVAQ